MPNHYQAAFHQALRVAGVDLKVCYYERVSAERVAMGWNTENSLPRGEAFVSQDRDVESVMDDFADRVHVIPGCASPFLRGLMRKLSSENARWAHWSEPSHPGWRRVVGLPLKRWYAAKVNRHGMGAFANGKLAEEDFASWGIRPEKISLLTYSTPEITGHEVDRECAEFCRDRSSFVFVGMMGHRKGTDLLLEAFANLKSCRTALVMVGPRCESYVRRASELGIASQVLFRGPLQPEKVASAIRACDVLVLPSRFDGWGVVLNEGAAAGKALIATDRCGGAFHLIEPSASGFRIAAGNGAALLNAMTQYVSQPNLAAEHGKRSKQLAADYSAPRNAQRMIESIESWSTSRKTA